MRRPPSAIRSRMARSALLALCLVGACMTDAFAGTAVNGEEHYGFVEGWRGPAGIWDFVHYALVCRPGGTCGLAGDGYMVAHVAIVVRRVRVGDVSRVICVEAIDGALGVTCKPGDVLFELHDRGKRRPSTVWKTMQPLLPENEKPGVHFRRVPQR